MPEVESETLRFALSNFEGLASSALARVEVTRAGRRAGADERRVQAVLGSLSLLAADQEIIDAAGAVDPVHLRSLDAVHVATASRMGPALGALVTYDRRMLTAAEALGLPTLSPA